MPLHPINISCIQLCKNMKLAKSYICHHIVKEVAHTFNLINFSSSFLWIDKICPVYTRIKNKQLSFVTRGYVVFKIQNNFSTINHTRICRIVYVHMYSYQYIGTISTLYLEIYSVFELQSFETHYIVGSDLYITSYGWHFSFSWFDYWWKSYSSGHLMISRYLIFDYWMEFINSNIPFNFKTIHSFLILV